MSRADSLARMMSRPIAHRGLHGCGGPGPVENTIAAAKAAAEAGYGIECDVRISRDGRPMVIHDATLTRLAGRTARVADLDSDDLAAIPLIGGGTIPLLASLLAAIGERATLVIEIKSGLGRAAIDTILDLVAAHDGPVVLESFDAAVVARCLRAPCPVGLVGPAEGDGDAEPPPRCDFLSWNVDGLDALAPDTRGLMPLTTWTVRSPAQAARAALAHAQIVFEGWRP